MSLRWLPSLLLPVLLLGCETLRSGAQPEQPLWVNRPSHSIEVVYRTSLVAPIRRFGEPYERGEAEIDEQGKRLFVGSSDRGLYCLDAVDGSVLWRFETAGIVQSAPLFDPAHDVVYFGSGDGALYKLDARNGQLRYRFATNAEVAERPVLVGNTLYFVNSNDTVLAIDANSGKMRWSQHRTPAMGMEIAGYSGLLYWRGKVYVGFSDGNVAAYNAKTGEEDWQPVDLAAEAEQSLGSVPQYFDVDTTPVACSLKAGPTILVASVAGGVFALDADTGTQTWSNPAVVGTSQLLLWKQPAHPDRQGGPPLPERQLVIAATGTTGLWALDPETGAEMWRTRLPAGAVAGPVPADGALLVSASQLGVFLLSPLDGRVIDGLHATDGISSLVGVRGNRAFILTNDGELLGLHLSSPLDLRDDNHVSLLGRGYQRGHW